MQGWLIYLRGDSLKNKWFINHLIEEANNIGIDLILKVVDDYQDFLKDNLQGPDFIINRSRIYQISQYYKQQDIPCFNNAFTNQIGNDKWEAYLKLKELNIPMVTTRLLKNRLVNNNYRVIKNRYGHGGNDVYLIKPNQPIDFPLNGSYIQQDFAKPGLDQRYYVLNGKIVLGIERSSHTDFRANYSLGGKVKIVEPSVKQKEIIKRIVEETGAFYIGVDFIFYHDDWVLNEIEDVVGMKMAYEISDLDLGKMFILEINSYLKGDKI